jgi:L-cysteine desulfidase
MAVAPQHFTLVADTEKVFTLDQNCAKIRIVVYANPATIFFNTRNAAIPAVSSSQDGNQVIPATLAVVEVDDETSGATSTVRLRSAGTPTVMVTGW